MTESAAITNARRFTLDGSEALEQRLAKLCEAAARGVQSLVPAGKLEALVLGGGYGRGQGGVLRDGFGDRAYNDLEFYVFIRGAARLNERRYHEALARLGDHLLPQLELHVEFKVYSAEKLRRQTITMFTYDLAAGHRVILGDEKVFSGCEHHLAAREIPLHEATRLLFNRCSGLLFSAARLRNPTFGSDDADFVGRNIAKTQLALGDVVLTVFGQYHWSVLERRARLAKMSPRGPLPWLGEVQRHHAIGAEFKLHPYRAQSSNVTLNSHHGEVSALAREVWLWLENRRLGAQFKSTTEYGLSTINKCRETSGAKNFLLNVNALGARALLNGNALRYPRERVLSALPLLLWPEANQNGSAERHLRRALVTGATNWEGFVSAYTRIWQRFS
jgi:hypothetical protein